MDKILSVTPVKFEDHAKVTSLMRRLDMVVPKSNADAQHLWSGLWLKNPALMYHGSNPALGWKVEDQGKIVAFFGNIPQISWIGKKKLRVFAARAWAVEKEYRFLVPKLCKAFFEQENADLVLISSANEPAGRRCIEYGGAKMPDPSYGEVLYWVVSLGGVARATLQKMGAPKNLSRIAAVAEIFPLSLITNITSKNLKNIKTLPIKFIEKEFDMLWNKIKIAHANRLLATRNAETLKWYFGLGSFAEKTKFIVHHKKGLLVGYAAVVREDVKSLNLKRLKIADLVVLENDPETIISLIAAAYREAQIQNCHVIELIGLPSDIRKVVSKLRPFRRSMSVFPFYYKALNSSLVSPLGQRKNWYVTSFDGDTGLV